MYKVEATIHCLDTNDWFVIDERGNELEKITLKTNLSAKLDENIKKLNLNTKKVNVQLTIEKDDVYYDSDEFVLVYNKNTKKWEWEN